MEIQEFVKELGLDKEVVADKGVPTVFLENSDEYAKAYTLLTQTELVTLLPESVIINQDIASLKCVGDEFEVTLSADLTRDIYKLVIEEKI